VTAAKALLLSGVLVGTGLLSFVVAEFLRRQSSRLGFTDHPNDRSLHVASTPRAGGAGFALVVPVAAAFGLSLVGNAVPSERAILAVALGVAAVGLIDDRWSLPPWMRLVLQLVAAAAVMGAGVVLQEVPLRVAGGSPGWARALISLLWIVGLTNIYNFMDGIDGIAATQGLITASTIALVALGAGRYDVAVVLATLDAGLIGFLVLNWPPARIFMGDVGSTFLGFMFAAWSILPAPPGSRAVPFLAWFVILGPFLFDASVTLARRAFRREPLFKAHRTHFYQRLVQAGWTHRQTTVLYAGIALWSGALTVCYYGLGASLPMLYVVCALLPAALPMLVVRQRAIRTV
jgi:Fuc2NAc and GlcNAc transferase